MQKPAVQFAKKPYLPLFSSETVDKFARDYTIEKSFRHALHLVTAHLHRQNQVAHALRTRDFWLASLSIDFPIHFTRRAHEYPVYLNCITSLTRTIGNGGRLTSTKNGWTRKGKPPPYASRPSRCLKVHPRLSIQPVGLLKMPPAFPLQFRILLVGGVKRRITTDYSAYAR